MQKVNSIRTALFYSLLVPTLLFSASAPLPIGAAFDRADLVVFAQKSTLARGPDGTVSVTLLLVKALKGMPMAGSITAVIGTNGMLRATLNPESSIERSATHLWFLKAHQTNGSYIVIPLVEGDFYWDDLFWDIDEAEWPSSGTLREQSLDAVVNAYLRPSRGRKRISDLALLVNLQNAEGAQCNSRAEYLASRTENKNRVLGIAAGLACGADWALEKLGRELTALKTEVSFEQITNALRWHFRPIDTSSLRQIEELIRLRTDAPGLDDSIAASLTRVNSKSVLPLFAQLLDSRDANAQLRAASFFAHFTRFADMGGNISPDQRIGPWHTDETKAAAPGRDSRTSNADIVAFWRAWWKKNRTKIPIP